jgi:hypothetical protein
MMHGLANPKFYIPLWQRNARVQLNLMGRTQITLAWKQSIPVCFILPNFSFYIYNGLYTIYNKRNLRQQFYKTFMICLLHTYESIPEQNCTIEIAYCQTIWHDKWQCDICNDNKCKNTSQEKYKTRETPGPRTVTTHSAKWHSVRIPTTFIIHHICTKLKIFTQICFGLQIFHSGFNKV